jgi:hypothetical protein
MILVAAFRQDVADLGQRVGRLAAPPGHPGPGASGA